MLRNGFVYMLASYRNGTLYVGVTNDLVRRISEHRDGLVPGFTARHGVKHLVWYETHTDVPAAIAREKTIKRWRRAWKLELVEAANPEWRDLWPTLLGKEPGPALQREYRWQMQRGPGSSPG